MEFFHSKGYLHRDVKPENFLISTDPIAKTIYIIDYGLSKPYRDPHTNKHIPFKSSKLLTGTARYASISNHKGEEHGRKDDLESLGYTLIYALTGRLPWQDIKAVTKEGKYAAIHSKKNSTQPEMLCKGLPTELMEYMKYVRSLKFEETPDYKSLKKLFVDLFFRVRRLTNFEFDWVKQKIDIGSIREIKCKPNESNQAECNEQNSEANNKSKQSQKRLIGIETPCFEDACKKNYQFPILMNEIIKKQKEEDIYNFKTEDINEDITLYSKIYNKII